MEEKKCMDCVHDEKQYSDFPCSICSYGSKDQFEPIKTDESELEI